MSQETQNAQEQTPQPDNGFGLAAFLSQGTEQEDSKGESSPAEAEESPSDEAKAEAEEKPGQKEESTEEEVKAESEEKTEEPEQKAEWDSDENPHKVEAAKLAERLKATRDYATRVNQQNAELAKKLEVLEKKIDGTYDADEDTRQVQQNQAASAELAGRVQSSIAAANRLYGEENVQKLLFAEDAPFRQLEESDTAVRARVMSSATPALEAIQVLRERDFFSRWGTDPDQIEAKIEAKIREKITKEVTEKVRKEFEGKIKLSGKSPASLTKARSSSAKEDPKSREKDGTFIPPLSAIGNPGLSR